MPGEEELRAGADAYARGEVAEARRIFAAVARDGEGWVRVAGLVNAASMADELGDHRAAAGWFEEALRGMEPGPTRARTLVNFSQALQHLGDLDGASRALAEARKLLGDDPEQGAVRVACLLSSTAVAIHRQRWAEAIELGRETLALTTRFVPELGGHPLMNLAAAYFESGRRELALDMAGQALDAFLAAGDENGVAETRQNLALMHIRSGAPGPARPLLETSQEYFERRGSTPRAGIGLKALGFLAEHDGDTDTAASRYRQSLAAFTAAGAELEAAEVRIRLATIAFAGDPADGERLLADAFRAFAARGLGLHCAQVDYWHAALLEATSPDPETARRAVLLAVPAALALDAVRHTFTNGNQRHEWNRHLAEPAIRLAFRLARLAGDGRLLADLVETCCAGATPVPHDAPPAAELPFTLPSPPPDPTDALRLGAALADAAGAAGLAVSPPPRLRFAADGRIALADHIAVAERRYGRPVRDDLVLTL
ncbi:tetratricopeptide repeat protein [Nocardia sp. NPDC004068]|uniref:tetratricopeptide repeat protein n=1 Tax=Nocardia sp. NPDC004068 TaxID=3364303 RepID=UPI0036A86275